MFVMSLMISSAKNGKEQNFNQNIKTKIKKVKELKVL